MSCPKVSGQRGWASGPEGEEGRPRGGGRAGHTPPAQVKQDSPLVASEVTLSGHEVCRGKHGRQGQGSGASSCRDGSMTCLLEIATCPCSDLNARDSYSLGTACSWLESALPALRWEVKDDSVLRLIRMPAGLRLCAHKCGHLSPLAARFVERVVLSSPSVGTFPSVDTRGGVPTMSCMA